MAADGILDSAVVQSHFDNDVFCGSGAESSEDEFEQVLKDNYSLHHLIGSCGAGHHVDPPKGTVVHIEGLNVYLTQPSFRGRVDVVGIFGGESGAGEALYPETIDAWGNI